LFVKFGIDLVCNGLRLFVSFICAMFLVLQSVFNFCHLVTDFLLNHSISGCMPLSLISVLPYLAGGYWRGKACTVIKAWKRHPSIGCCSRGCSAARFCPSFFFFLGYTVAIELETAISHISQGTQGQYSRVPNPVSLRAHQRE
jgi:hypothetical protein